MPTPVTRGQMAFVLIAVLAAFLFVRLGLWQLERHAEKREAVALREARLAEPPIPLSNLLRDGPSGHRPDDAMEWRRVTIAGTWDYGGEALIRTRGMNGRPGVHVVTPLRPDSPLRPDPPLPPVLVLRGWLPAPDAIEPAAIDTTDRGLPASVGRMGVIRASREDAGGAVVPAGEGGARRPTFAAIDVGAIGAEVGLDAAPFFVQLLPREERPGGGGDPAAGEGRPVAVPVPEADSGPHMAYAIQWFAFALIALVGTAAWLWHPGRRERRRAPASGGTDDGGTSGS